MRLTVRVPDDLHRRAEERAEGAGVSLAQFVEQALRLALEDEPAPSTSAPWQVRPLPGGRGLQPGVDLRDRSSLSDRLDEA